jgi:predicted dehydrogenase
MIMPRRLRAGVIGAGAIGPAHLRGYQAARGVETAAVCDVHKGRAEAAAAQFGAKHVFTDYRKMLAADAVDLVSVCTPNNTHMPITIAALQAGKHVLCEKPLAMNGQQARRMVAAARRSRRILMTAQSMRYGSGAQLLKKMADAGRFGELYFGKGMMLRRAGIPRGWFQDSRQSGGGPLIDIGVHVLDFLWWVMGTPRPVSAFGVTFDHLGATGQGMGGWGINYAPGKFSVEDLAAGLIRFAGGQAISIEVSWAAHTSDSYFARIMGTRGGAQLSPELVLYETTDGVSAEVRPQPPSADGYLVEVDHFVRSIQKGTQPMSPAAQSVVVMDTLDAIYKSARTGRMVSLAARRA